MMADDLAIAGRPKREVNGLVGMSSAKNDEDVGAENSFGQLGTFDRSRKADGHRPNQ